ncbi:DUF748 domain-containing protein [Shewanella sp. A14]
MTSFFSQLSSAFRLRSRIQKLTFYMFAFYLLGCAIFGGLIPYIAKQQAPVILTEQLGRNVTLQDIRINPFTLEITLSGLVINELNSQKIFASLAIAYGNIQLWQSITSWSWVIEDIRVEQPTIRVSRTQIDNHQVTFNFSDIIQRLEKSTLGAPTSTKPTSIPAINIAKVQILKGMFILDDHATNTHINYPDISVELTQFDSLSATLDTQSKQINHYKLNIEDQFNGTVALQGQFQLAPLAIQGDLKVADVDLSRYWSFVNELFAINLSEGRLNINGQYSVVLQDQDLASVSHINVTNAQIMIDHFKALHQQDEKITIDLLALRNINVDSQKKHISIDEFHTQNGKVKLNITPSGTDLITLLLPKETELTAETVSKPKTITQSEAISKPLTETSVDNTAKTTNLVLPSPNEVKAAQTNMADIPWLVTLHKINVAKYQVDLGEGIASDNIILWQLGLIDVTTGLINSDLSTPIDYQFSTTINKQSVLTSTGQIDALAQTVNAEIDFSNMLLSRLQPYIAPYINVTITDGLFSTKGNLQADAKATLTYSGSAKISQLHIKDNVLKQPLLTWETMDINRLSFDKQQNQIDIDEINFDNLFSRLIISPDKSTNINALIRNESVSVESPDNLVVEDSANDSSPLQLNINRIGIKDSSAFFADNSLTPHFASSIEMLNGQISHLSSNPETTASVDLKGKIDRYAPVILNGNINPLLPQPYLDLNLSFDKVELTSVNPYSGTYAGYYIDKGQLSLDLNYQLKSNALVGSNHLVIDQLKLGKPSNSSLATSLPVTLAVALLQDRHGVIDLGVDVSGEVDSPSFSFGSIIINALGNIITKAVTSPFSFLAGLVGGDEGMGKIRFDYGESNISLKQKDTLDKLAEALIDRPLLNLNIKGSVDLIHDKQALAETKLHKQLSATAGIAWKDFPKALSASQFPQTGSLTDALYQLIEQALSLQPSEIKHALQTDNPELTEAELITRWHIELYNMLQNHQQFSADDLGQLAQDRAKAVKAYLIAHAKIDAGKVFVLESRINTAENAAEALLELQVK